jgi:MFS family permease
VPVPRAAYWTLAALFGINLLNFTDRYILGAVLKPIQEPRESGGLGLNDTEGGFVVSAFFFAYALISPLIMWLGDRVNRKYVLAGCIALWSLATFGSGLARSFEELVAARIVLAVGEATFTTLAPTVLADLFPRHKRGWAMTMFYLAVPLGAALGYPLGGTIAAQGIGYWRYAFYVVGLPGLLVAVAALALPEPIRGASEGVDEVALNVHRAHRFSWAQMLATLLRTPSFVFNCLGMAMFTFAIGGVQVWVAKYFVLTTGQNLDVVDSWLGVVLVVSGLIGTALGGWLADRLTRRWRGAYFSLSGLGLLLCIPFLVTALLSTWSTIIYPCLGVGLTLAFLNIGPSNAILANVTAPRMRAAAVAVNLFCIRALGDIPAPWLMGVVSDWRGHLFWGVILAAPALLLGGLFFCLGTPFLGPDQDAVREQLRADQRQNPAGAGFT